MTLAADSASRSVEPGSLITINSVRSATAEHHQRIGVVCAEADDFWDVLVADANRTTSCYAPARWIPLRLAACELTVPADFSVRALLTDPTDAALVCAMLTEVVRRQAVRISELRAAAVQAGTAGDLLAQATPGTGLLHDLGITEPLGSHKAPFEDAGETPS